MKILITGASGSIGSELVRQLCLDPKNEIICFDRNEEKVFYLEKQIRETFPNTKFSVCLGDIANIERVKQVFELHKPDVVYHTAANKHVPLGETNVHEFVHNNILGTINVIHTAVKYVHTFVFISTDKAVEPSSVMGYTKRVCELFIQDIKHMYQNTVFITCRFGNIVGSSGSVYQLFEKQVLEGKIKVTHPEMERYFIKCQDAVKYLIECSKLEEGLYTFNMGKPVKILYIAEEYSKSYDVPIEITGLRPGEKIKEKLFYDDEEFYPVTDNILGIISKDKPNKLLDIYSLVNNAPYMSEKYIKNQLKIINNEHD